MAGQHPSATGTRIKRFLNDYKLNLSCNDLAICSHCRKRIPLTVTLTFTGFDQHQVPVYSVEYDRSNRVDCDKSKGEETAQHVSYHRECYDKLIG